MRLSKWLVIGLLLSCWLSSAACQGRQTQSVGVTPAAADVSQKQAPKTQAQTRDYINAWTFPDADPSPESTASAPSKEGRERMLADETDSYIRAFTFPTLSDEKQKKPAAVSESHPSRPRPTPADNIDEYINGWTFE